MIILMTKIREDAGLTKMALASRSNVHPSRISAIELQRATPLSEGAEMTRIWMALRAFGFHGDPDDLLKPVEEPAKPASA